MKLPYRWELVAWLCIAYLLNQADRQILYVVLPLVKPELGLSDVQAGFVTSVLTIVLAVMIPVAGYVGDIYSRKKIIVFSLLFWSLSTLLTGFSTGFIYLIFVRSVATGVGEALYAPSAFALIGEYHVEQRAQAMAAHQAAVYVGVVFSGLVAGYLGDRFGWRAAFWTFGFAGIAAAALMQRRLRTSTAKAALAPARPPAAQALRAAAGKPTAVLLAVALGGAVFVNVGFLTWMPTYLHERFHLSLASAGFSSMFFHFMSAFFGVMLGGRLSDRMARKRPRFRLELQAAGLLLAAPFLFLLGGATNLAWALVLLGAFGLFRGIYDSNIYASLYEVVQPRFHASATGAITAFAFTLGALAPIALGAMKQTVGLGPGISGLSLAYVLSGALVCVAAWAYFERDYSLSHGETQCSVLMEE